MVNSQYIHYDENVDHLTIYRSNEKIVSTLDLGFVLLSLDKEKKVVGIEFMGAHKNFKIPLNMLAGVNIPSTNSFS